MEAGGKGSEDGQKHEVERKLGEGGTLPILSPLEIDDRLYSQSLVHLSWHVAVLHAHLHKEDL